MYVYYMKTKLQDCSCTHYNYSSFSHKIWKLQGCFEICVQPKQTHIMDVFGQESLKILMPGVCQC